MRISLTALALLALTAQAGAETLTLTPQPVTDWKAVYGRVEARDRIPARARLGGTLVELTVQEGDIVAAGQPLARIVDEKLAFQLSALQSQETAVKAQLTNAETDLKRGEDLRQQGVTTQQRLDALRTQVDVLRGQLATLMAQAEVIMQQQAEGAVLAPVAGRVLEVPVARGAVIMPGEPVATLAGGGTFLRLAVPERHAANLQEGDPIFIDNAQTGAAQDGAEGRIVKVYPLIEGGRVVADVDLPGLSDRFVDARLLVRLPVGSREALVVPASALVSRNGLDFVGVQTESGVMLRAVVPGQRMADGVEILTGLQAGDKVLTTAPQDAGPEATSEAAAHE